MGEVTISNLLVLSQKYTTGLSSSAFKVDPGVKGEVTLSLDHPQLLCLRDSSGSIPCICPEFSINILGNVITATRWHLTGVHNEFEFDLPDFYLEISEFEVREAAVTPVLSDGILGKRHYIMAHSDSVMETLSGRLLHVYPVYRLNVYTYLLLFDIQDERVYVMFTGDDLLTLHALLKSGKEYRITNTRRTENKKVKMFVSTHETNVMPFASGSSTADPPTQIHDDHSTIEGVVTEFVELESGHFVLDSSIHLFLCHMPNFLPVWGMKVGAKIRVSEVKMCSLGSEEGLTQYAWCCLHSRIKVLSLHNDTLPFYPYLPRMFSPLILYADLIPSSALHLTLILEKFRKRFEIVHDIIQPIMELFDLKHLPPSDPVSELKTIFSTEYCNVTPFNESSLPTTFSVTDLTEWLSISHSYDDFKSELNMTKFDFTLYPSWEQIKHSSVLVDDMMKGVLIGRVALCPDTGHVVLSDPNANIPIHFTSDVYPDQLASLLDSVVAIKNYELTVERSSFPNQISKLTRTYISTQYKNLFTILPGSNKTDRSGLYMIYVMGKSDLKLDLSPSKKVKLKFIAYTKIYVNCISSDSQFARDPTHTLIGELPLVFVSDMIKWWKMIESGWIYHWNGYSTSQISPYIISRGNNLLFREEWSLYPIGQPFSDRPPLAPENDIITLLHKVKEGECRTFTVAGKINKVTFIPNTFQKSQFAFKNKEWVVERQNFRPIRLSDLEKHQFLLLTLFYSLKVSVTFPVTDTLFLPIYINLPLGRMPFGLDEGSWVRLTGVKIRYQNSMLRGNIDNRGSIELMSHPPPPHLPPSIYCRIKPLSPSNFKTFQTISLRVAKSLTQEETTDHTTQTTSPVKGMYSNRFAFCKEQRVVELEKRRMQKFSILIRAYKKILRLFLRVEKMLSLVIQKSCYCCKAQPSVISSCPKATFKVTSDLFACIGNETVIVKSTNLCTKLLTNISELQMDELIRLLENKNTLEIDKNFFDTQPSAPRWLYKLFFDFKTSKLDAIVTHHSINEQNTTGKYPVMLTLYYFKLV